MDISIRDFKFVFSGYGHYKVIYTSPKTNKSWMRIINDMTIIDATKGAEYPKKVDLVRLKKMVKLADHIIKTP